MAFEFIRSGDKPGGPTVTVTRRVYLDAKGQATADPVKGVRLFATEGDEIDRKEAEKVGLLAKSRKVQQDPPPPPPANSGDDGGGQDAGDGDGTPPAGEGDTPPAGDASSAGDGGGSKPPAKKAAAKKAAKTSK